MPPTSELQDQIEQLYYQRFSGYEGGRLLSYPILPVVTERYLNSRVVIIGQETNTWYPRSEESEDLRDGFLAGRHEVVVHDEDPSGKARSTTATRYTHFMRLLKERGYSGHFWPFVQSLYGEGGVLPGPMVDEQDRLGHLWLNLYSTEAIVKKSSGQGAPTSLRTLKQEILQLQGDLLHQTLQLLKPRFVICCTGPQNNEALRISLGLEPGSSFEEVVGTRLPRHKKRSRPGFNVRQLARAEIDVGAQVPATLLRTYHPTWFTSRINGQRRYWELNPNGETLAEAYTRTVMEEARRVVRA